MTEIQKKEIVRLCHKHHLWFCVLFGSGADEKNKHLQRDFDLAFYGGKRLPTDVKLVLFDELQPYFEKPVDIILIQPLMDPLLAYEISIKGKLICELKEDTFLTFQTRAWKDYFDSERYREYEKKYIRKRIKNVS